jgi:glycine dehydrogenase subunit 1
MGKKPTHPYLPSSAAEVKAQMMNALGILDVEELYADVPQEVRLKKKLNLPGPMSELEVKRHVEQLLSVNKGVPEIRSFLGGGCWNHYVPAAVSEISTRSEFVTAYTPYQAEISQGMLQSLFEYQSLICQLTAMDYANSSLYDWASALGEAARMATRATQRTEFLVPHHIHPDRLATLRTYSEPAGIAIKEVRNDEDTGQIDLADLERKMTKDCSAVYVENPSYLGCVQTRVQEVAEIAHSRGALFVAGVDLTSLGLLKPPGEYGADIAIAEGQCLGGAMNYGGPLLGVFACKGERLLRQMPGRIIGITTTKDKTQRAYCMVLQAREQHIRREKATSNICTNEALCALTAATYLSLLGAQGMKQLSEVILSKTYYAIRELSRLKALRVPLMKAPHFKEFTVNFDKTGRKVKELELALIKKGIQIGAPTTESIPELGQTAIFSFAETHSKEDIDALCAALREILEAQR